MTYTSRTSSVPRLPAPRPIAVAELDLDGPDGKVLSLVPAPGGPPPGEGDIYALVRIEGRPVATVLGQVKPGEDPAEALAAAFRARKGDPYEDDDPGPRAAPAGGDLPRTTVVVATRERAGQLGRALDSLLAQDHPDFRILVVDNAPVTTATRDLVASRYAGRVGYVTEPRPGLAVAHNRGIADADGAVIAFTDDDVVADPHWLTALTA
ncbi:glycosyltransferase family 2 protein, partial [Streptomyces sp. NPDC087850]